MSAAVIGGAISGTEILLRGGHTRTGLDPNADIAHGHLGAGNSAKQHQFVEIAKVADTE